MASGVYGQSFGGGVNVDIGLGIAIDPFGFTDRFSGIEQVNGRQGYNDTLRGGSGNDRFGGTTGNDAYQGAGGNDTLDYVATLGASQRLLVTALAPDAGLFGFGNLTVAKTAVVGGAVSNDTLASINVVFGGGAADRFVGADVAYSYNTYVFRGGAGDDTVEGFGRGSNRVDYQSAAAAVTLDLQVSIDGQGRRIGSASDGDGGTDALIDVVHVRGSANDDTLLGSDRNDTFVLGAAGQHTVDGRAGGNGVRYTGSDDVTIDLGTVVAAGGFGGFLGSITKAAGTDSLANIAIAQGGFGNDAVFGTSGDNALSGGLGNNTIDGRTGDDSLEYGLAAGLTLATTGAVVNLGDGFTGTATNPWGGTDTLFSIESAAGTVFADDLTGANRSGLFSFLRGEGGNDTLRAAAVDTLVVADYRTSLTRVVVDLGAGQTTDDGWFGGTDTLVNIQAARGSDFNDSLRGGTREDRLEGGAGNDTIDGGLGIDVLIGGAGDDTYVLDTNDDVTQELPGGGTDTAVVAFTHALRLTFENLILTGSAALVGAGNALNNALTGNAGGNRLLGREGDDTVAGGLGLDTIYGEAGNDSLSGDDGTDFVAGGDGTDTLLGGAGNDTLFGEAGGDSLLGEGGDDRLLGGFGADTMAGADGGDTLYGQADADSMTGAAGRDWLIAGDGDDTLDGGDDVDAMYGEAGSDSLLGGAGGDYLFGGAEADTLDGGTSADWLQGGAGDDLYFVDVTADIVVEAAGEGMDTVIAAVNGGGFYLANNVDVLIMTGATTFGHGNTGDNRIVGTDQNNTLLGWFGNDTLIGGRGNDNIYGQPGGDVIVHRPDDDVDTIVDFNRTVDRVDLTAYGFTGFAQIAGNIGQFGTLASLNLFNGDRINFLNTQATDLQAQHFLF